MVASNTNTVPWFEDLLRQLVSRSTSKSLHHGLLFSGSEGIGKTDLVNHLAKAVLCHSPINEHACGKCQACLLFEAGSHPDFHVVESEKQIGVDAIRGVSSQLSKTAQIGHNKVCIIYSAETMTEAAANALLKTLEEPTPDTYLLLVCNAQHRLLPTILSRCEKHVLAAPSQSETQYWLAQSFPNIPLSDSLLTLYGRAPYLLVQRYESNNVPDIVKLEADLKSVAAGNKTALSVAKAYEEDAELVVSWCQNLAQKRYTTSLNITQRKPYEVCLEARSRLLQAGINKVLLLQSVIETTMSTFKE